MILPFSSQCLQKKCTHCGVRVGEQVVTCAEIGPIFGRRAEASRKYGSGPDGLAALKLAARGTDPKTRTPALVAAYILAADTALATLQHGVGSDASDADFAAIEQTLADISRELFGYWREAGCLSWNGPQKPLRLTDIIAKETNAPKRPRRRLSDTKGR